VNTSEHVKAVADVENLLTLNQKVDAGWRTTVEEGQPI